MCVGVPGRLYSVAKNYRKLNYDMENHMHNYEFVIYINALNLGIIGLL